MSTPADDLFDEQPRHGLEPEVKTGIEHGGYTMVVAWRAAQYNEFLSGQRPDWERGFTRYLFFG